MTMNGDQLDALWDNRRDGDLSDDQAAAFDEALARDPRRARLWQREQQWLAMLAEPVASNPEEARAFAGRVLVRERRVRHAGVLARLGGLAAAAAAIAMTAWVFWPQAPDSGDVAAPRVVQTPVVPEPEGDALSVLLRETNRQLEAKPAQLAHAVNQSSALFELGSFLGVVDPAEAQAQP